MALKHAGDGGSRGTQLLDVPMRVAVLDCLLHVGRPTVPLRIQELRRVVLDGPGEDRSTYARRQGRQLDQESSVLLHRFLDIAVRLVAGDAACVRLAQVLERCDIAGALGPRLMPMLRHPGVRGAARGAGAAR